MEKGVAEPTQIRMSGLANTNEDERGSKMKVAEASSIDENEQGSK